MQLDIILSGVGGQGILTIATVIGNAALRKDMFLKQAEVHGMSQRGGDVQSNLRISTTPIASDLIPLGGADIIISLEPMEALRYLPYLKEEGYVVTNSAPFINITNYPAYEEIEKALKQVKNHVALDLDEIAKSAGSIRTANMVLLGAASAHLPLEPSDLLQAISDLFERKGEEIIKMNINAFNKGREMAQKLY